MGFALGFLLVSFILCILVNVGAAIAEKVQKKKTVKMSKDVKEA